MALKDFMARAQGSEVAASELPEPPPVAATRPAAPSPTHTSHLGASIVFSGELRCGEPLRIDGHVKGEVRCDHLIIIGEKGTVHAAIDGDTVMIAGEVQGDIKARRKITLEPTARVTGDLTTPGIVIQEGARLEGRIMIGAETRPDADPAATEAPRAQAKPEASKDAPPRPPVVASPA